MPTIRAWQHIYTNVERDRSPTKTSGFQTLFYSKDGLTADDINDIEERVFYVYGNPNPVKRVFFPLRSNKIGVSQILPIEGRDVAGREGLYIAHSLIFSLEDLQAIQINPMDTFQCDFFITSLEGAFSKGDKLSGNIDSVTLDLPAPTSPRHSWPPDEFRHLIQLAINQENLKKERSALALVGSSKEIEETLQSILPFMPSSLVTGCTFDTFFERGGNLSFTYYWGAGFLEKPPQPFYIVVDVDAKTITNAGTFAKTASSFGRWMDQQLAAGSVSNNAASVLSNKHDALTIGNYLDKHEGDAETINALDISLLQSVLSVNESVVEVGVREKIAALLPAPLTDKLFPTIYDRLNTSGIIQIWDHGFDIDELLEELYALYEKASFRSPGKEERYVLAEVLEKHKYQGLEWLLLIWGGASWANPVAKWRIRAGVEKMDDNAYQGFWDLAIHNELIDPMELLVEGKEAIFTTLAARDRRLPLDEIPSLVKALVKSDNAVSLNQLAPFLKNLDKKQIKKVKRRIKDIEGVSPEFMQTLTLLES